MRTVGFVGAEHLRGAQPALERLLEPARHQAGVQAGQAAGHESGRDRRGEQRGHQVRGPLHAHHVAAGQQGGGRDHVRPVADRPRHPRRHRRGRGRPAAPADLAHHLVLGNRHLDRRDVEDLHRAGDLPRRAGQSAPAPRAASRLDDLAVVRDRDPLQRTTRMTRLPALLPAGGPAPAPPPLRRRLGSVLRRRSRAVRGVHPKASLQLRDLRLQRLDQLALRAELLGLRVDQLALRLDLPRLRVDPGILRGEQGPLPGDHLPQPGIHRAQVGHKPR